MTTNFKPVKMAILGFVNGHVPYWYTLAKRNPHVEVVAVSIDPTVDIYNLTKRMTRGETKPYNELYDELWDGVEIFHDDEELLKAHPDVEMAVLGGSNKDHMKEFRLCAERGIHVVSMKVPTMDMDEYDEMLRLQKEHNIIVHTELEMRWKANTERLKDVVASGELGEIDSFTAINFSHFPIWDTWIKIPEEMYGKRIPIKPGSKLFRGGALTDHPHIFDLVRYIFESDFDTIYAEIGPNMREDNIVEDFAYITGRLKNGVIVSLDPSYANREAPGTACTGVWDWVKSPRIVQVEMQINGSKGTAYSDGYLSDTVEAMLPNTNYIVISTGNGVPSSTGQSATLTTLARQIRLGKDLYKPVVSFEDHKKTIQTMLAAYESIATGEVVKVKYD